MIERNTPVVDAQQIVASVRVAFAEVLTPDDLPSATAGADYVDNHAAGAAGVRVAHAIAALRAPDAVQVFAGDESQHVLVSKRIAVATPFTMLLELNRRGGGLHLVGAWRLFNPASQAQPLDLFAGVVERYGVVVRFGGLVSDNFVARITVPEFEGQDTEMLTFEGKPPGKIGAALMVRKSMTGDWDLEWGYAIDLDAYARDAARQQG